jgi:hypothetical protein
MRVQDLLLAALFLEGIVEALVVIRGHLRVFEGTAESELCQSRFPVCDDAYKTSLFTKKVLDSCERWRYVVAHDGRNQGKHPVRCCAPGEL